MAETFDAPQSRNEAILQNMLGAENVLPEPQSRIEDLLQQILEAWQDYGGLTPEEIAAAVEAYLEDHPIEAPVTSVNGDTGDVVITAADLGALTAADLESAINAALAAASASGDFDGADGISPTVSITAITGGHRVTITDANETQTFDVMDGTNGTPGTPGTDGTTFTPSVSPAGVISWTNDGGKQNPASVNVVTAVINALPTWTGGSY